MQIGINQNIVFKGERFHIQTEDSGKKRPVITTILFKGGLIVGSRKVSYDDKLDSDDLGKVVLELMQGQHKDVIRALKNGDFKKDKKAGAASEEAAPIELSSEPPAPAEAESKSKHPLMVSKKALDNKVLECLSLK